MRWLKQVATEDYDCPRCKQTKGNQCRTPKGRKTDTHCKRINEVPNEQAKRECTVKISRIEDIIRKFNKKKEK